MKTIIGFVLLQFLFISNYAQPFVDVNRSAYSLPEALAESSNSPQVLTSITTSAINPLTLCAGAGVSVPFTINSAANAGNVFTAQLSNGSGSFATPVNIGTLSSVNAGTISAIIPANTLVGSAYRIRVVSSNPVITGTDNGANILINPLPIASVITSSGSLSFCVGTINPPVLSGNNNGGVWNTGSTASSITIFSAGTFYVTNTNACGSVQSNSITTSIYSLAPPVVHLPGGSTSGNICLGGGSVIINEDGYLTGSWYYNGGQLIGQNSPQLAATTAGNYSFVGHQLSGCNSPMSNTVTLTATTPPVVTISGLASTYNVNAAPVTLTGSPAGGTFAGQGISGNTFNPALAGVGGPYTITYYYSDFASCSGSASQQVTVTANNCTLPAQPGAITTTGGIVKVCPGDVRTYSIAAVTGATSYSWTAPAGSSITSGQGTTSITVLYNSNFTGDTLRVKAVNSCGGGPLRNLRINKNAAASTPSAITGPAIAVCNLSNQAYSVTAVTGVTYAWSWNVTGATITSGQGTNAIRVNYGSSFVSGRLSVTATNACGTSSPRNLMVYARPATPTSITGSTTVCPGDHQPYSISPVSNASSYTWFVPTGSTITAGATTSTGTSLSTTATNVTVNVGNTAGQVRVRGVNACASGSLAALTVAFGASCRNTFTGKGMGGTIDASNDTHNALLFPNPSKGTFTISNIKETGEATITILNQLGAVLFETKQVISGGTIRINTGNKIGNGVYIVRYAANGKSHTQKITIIN